MKTLNWMVALFFAVLCSPLFAQDDTEADSTGLPGDHFSLEGAIELFKKSDSPEDFEKRLNADGNDVNNLDLNEDGQVDYIRVLDNMGSETHALVLQAVISDSESQDVAVIEIEKDGKEEAILQIIGDEDLYGEQAIVEPFDEEEIDDDGDHGPAAHMGPIRIVVNVWLWPSVRFMYAPGYRVWVSPWRWGVYPGWWRPWRPHPWRAFHVRVAPFRAHYHVVGVHRVHRAHAVYAPHRRHSTVVHTRTTTVVKARGPHGGVYGKRTTTTTVKNDRGTHTKKTTTVGRKGKDGNVGVKKTTTKTTRKRRN